MGSFLLCEMPEETFIAKDSDTRGLANASVLGLLLGHVAMQHFDHACFNQNSMKKAHPLGNVRSAPYLNMIQRD